MDRRNDTLSGCLTDWHIHWLLPFFSTFKKLNFCCCCWWWWYCVSKTVLHSHHNKEWVHFFSISMSLFMFYNSLPSGFRLIRGVKLSLIFKMRQKIFEWLLRFHKKMSILSSTLRMWRTQMFLEEKKLEENAYSFFFFHISLLNFSFMVLLLFLFS